MTKVQLNKDEFERLDFSESILIFHPPTFPISIFEIRIWGVTLLKNHDWQFSTCSDPLIDIKKEDQFVADFSKLSFVNVGSIKISAKPFDNDSQSGFFVNRITNTDIVLEKKWNGSFAKDLSQFQMACILDWPSGFCNLTVLCEKCEFSFDKNKLISVAEFCKKPSDYIPKALR
ncbi:hypothetical protein SCOR_00010 [Sulfidibacter corallicola]|uniref:Uncharacterized protein n=1 Tax=Sulfidibacter corallicola TaxID=2818388 RepID=A0A8A4TIV9_SULCO|nr:hypothetical protein [Sulfidibacter corallicola]QTD49092.1 hypothetical protein J3U87_26190 [Sulfidibacter corallicola]